MATRFPTQRMLSDLYSEFEADAFFPMNSLDYDPISGEGPALDTLKTPF
jgi:hypothetical protein